MKKLVDSKNLNFGEKQGVMTNMIKNKDNQFITRKQLNLAIENIITVIEQTNGVLLKIIAEQRDEINNLKKTIRKGVK